MSLFSGSLPSGYLNQLVDRLDMSGSLSSVVGPLFLLLQKRASSASLEDGSFAEVIGIFIELMQCKKIAHLVISHPQSRWLSPSYITGRQLQRESYLGSFLTFGAIPTETDQNAASNFFADPDAMSNSQKEDARLALRSKISPLIQSLQRCLLELIKVFKDDGKEAWLSWVAQLLQLNQGLAHTNQDTSRVCDLPLMLNAGQVLLLFCNPILDQDRKAVRLFSLHLG